MSLETRYERVKDNVAAACGRVGRDVGEVRIVAVSKTVEPPVVGEAIEAGVTDFGENRIEVMIPKVELYPDAHWHFIGNIQRRKIADIVANAELIHSVDRADILPRLERCSAEAGKVSRILLEVNVSGEQSKSGFTPDAVAEVCATFGGYPHLKVEGLMTMAPQGAGKLIRSTFSGLRELRDVLQGTSLPANVEMRELSMGMSEDYETAVEEGATIVRVGRCVFSEDFEQQTP
jgi:pyridoxal phosphate enzyme (YggS family)